MNEQVSPVSSAAARAERARPARSGGPLPPVSNRGGKSPYEAVQGARAKVDWLTVTWKPSPDELVNFQSFELLTAWLGGSVVGEDSPGLLGYAHGCRFYVVIHGTPVYVARVDWGGEHHGGRARLDLTASACGRVRGWAGVAAEVGRWDETKLTRVDLAVDCLMGEYTVEDARDWYLAGEFHSGGRRPRHSLIGDWLDPHYGRTINVGRRENGKMLRAYEKGRQLGDSASPWTRFEVELRNIDRELPLDVLTNSDAYFVGAYEALARLLDCSALRIATDQAEGEIALGSLVTYQRAAYGRLITVLRGKLEAGQVLDLLCRPGLPRRLEKSSLTAFDLIGADALIQRFAGETHQELIQ